MSRWLILTAAFGCFIAALGFEACTPQQQVVFTAVQRAACAAQTVANTLTDQYLAEGNKDGAAGSAEASKYLGMGCFWGQIVGAGLSVIPK